MRHAAAVRFAWWIEFGFRGTIQVKSPNSKPVRVSASVESSSEQHSRFSALPLLWPYLARYRGLLIG